MDELDHQIRPAFDREIIVNTRNGGMMESRQQIGFPLEVLDDRIAHEGVGRGVDHFLDRHQLRHIGEVHITCAIHRSHAAYADDLLNRITIREQSACLKLARRAGIFIALII
jgi:hypothetical protein